MKSNLIMKIALGVAAFAVLFSVVTLIRAIVKGSWVVFPILQTVGSIAIAAICWFLFNSLRGGTEEEDEGSQDDSDDTAAQTADEDDAAADVQPEDVFDERADVQDDEYHFSNFES